MCKTPVEPSNPLILTLFQKRQFAASPSYLPSFNESACYLSDKFRESILHFKLFAVDDKISYTLLQTYVTISLHNLKLQAFLFPHTALVKSMCVH